MFRAQDLPLLVRLRPSATLRQLWVSFPVADFRGAYRSKPTAYVASLLGHEGQGSLLARLKAEGLAETLSAGTGLAWRGGSLFTVTIGLTPQGVEAHPQVLRLLYGYLDMLRTAGPQAWYYAEAARLAELRFRFREQGKALEYVAGLARDMHDYAPRDLLSGGYLMEQFDPAGINELIAGLTPGNAVVFLVDEGVPTDRISAHYGVPYSVEPRAAVLGALATDTQATPAADAAAQAGGASDAATNAATSTSTSTSTSTKFALPVPNAFIPRDLALVELARKYSRQPELVHEQGRQRVWFGQDRDFRVPRGAIYVHFRSARVRENPRQAAAAALYARLVTDELAELSYPAQVAGLGLNLYPGYRSIGLRISGYNDRQLAYLQQALRTLRAPALDAGRFEHLRQQRLRELRNRPAQQPAGQVMTRLGDALLHVQWGDAAMIAAYEALSLDELRGFVAAFWRGAAAEALVYGNFELAAAASVAELLAELFCGAAPAGPGVDCGGEDAPVAPVSESSPGLRVTRLPAQQSALWPVDIAHDDAVVAWYLQGADNSWQDRAAAALTAQIIGPEFFRQLRTEQQLGYQVSAFAYPQLGVPGVVLLVQSPVASTPHITQAMQAFLQGVPGELDGGQYRRHRAAAIGEITQPDSNLWERVEYYWQQLEQGHYAFDERERLASALRRTSMSEWSDYFERVFLARRHALMVVAPGKRGALPEAEQRFASAAEIKQANAYYEVE
jgi:secreted Zn-dependent insulinase-like peptidase